MIRSLVVFVCLLVGAPQARVGGFDFSGIDAFWPVRDALSRGQEPAPAAWDRMFATPGYAALETRERRRAALETAMRAAFNPARTAERDSLLRTNTFASRAARHLMGVAAARDSMDRFRATLTNSTVLDAARRRVADFVPRGLTDTVAPPPVALVLFLNDGRGYPAVIVADLLRLLRTGVDTSYFAHEFFHSYRRRFGVAYRAHAPQDAGLEELLAYPVEEGVADQLDKRVFVDLSDAEFASYMKRPGALVYAPEYRANHSRAAEWMALVSRTLERTAARPDSAAAIARRDRDSLPDSGRPLGAFMARTIDRQLGRSALIRVAGDTYGFWLDYDRAAEAANTPRLSAAALAVVRRLSAQYR
jgi:hypothetical protein